jgi:hypothetical protein
MNQAPANTALPEGSLKARFDRDGYLTIPSVTSVADIVRIRSLLDPLFEKFETLGTRAVDIAGPYRPGESPRSPEIGEPSALAPALLETQAFVRCRELARELLGVPVGHVYDHAIYKSPHNESATGWHQDQVYAQGAIAPWSVHFWLPLQEATVANGCMWYVPGSHLGGLAAHRVATPRTAGSTTISAGATLTLEAVDAAQGVACPLPVGGVSVHHPLTYHYAGPNQTAEPRRAWILHFGAFGHWRSKWHPKALMAKVRRKLGGG